MKSPTFCVWAKTAITAVNSVRIVSSLFIACKGSANRTKMQINLQFSEMQPTFGQWPKVVFFEELEKSEKLKKLKKMAVHTN